MRKTSISNKIISLMLAFAIIASASVFVVAGLPVVKGLTARSECFQQITLKWKPLLIEDTMHNLDPETYPSEESDANPMESAENDESVNKQDAIDQSESNTDQESQDQSKSSSELGDEAPAPTVSSPVKAAPAEPVYLKISYDIYRSTTRDGEYKKIASTTKTTWTDTGLTTGRLYYYRIQAKSAYGKHGFSSFASARPLRTMTAAVDLIKKGDVFWNLREEAGQALYDYDTMQGVCANDGFAYFTLYNRNVENCKLIKVKLDDMSVVKISEPIVEMYHANSVAYNSETNQLVVACTREKMKNICVIDAETLTLVMTKTINLDSSVKNITSTALKKYVGLTGVAYDAENNCYYARLRTLRDYVKLDANFNPIQYIDTALQRPYLTYQAMDATGEYIFDVQSFKDNYLYNLITVRTNTGKYIGELKVPYGNAAGMELECIFEDNGQYYLGFYMSRNEKDKDGKSFVNRYNFVYKLSIWGRS